MQKEVVVATIEAVVAIGLTARGSGASEGVERPKSGRDDQGEVFVAGVLQEIRNMDDRHLDFEAHMVWCSSINDDPEEAYKNAQARHAAFVHSALGKLLINMAILSGKLSRKNAQYYMTYGVGRRLKMIQSSYQTIISVATPERIEPLSHDELQSLTRDINVAYMNIRGTMDNFAWCFLLEKDSKLIGQISKNDISLFSKKIRRMTEFQEFW